MAWDDAENGAVARAAAPARSGLGPVEGVAEQVLVLGMPESLDRRENARAALAGLGVSRYAFFDAGGPEHPDTRGLIDSGAVAQFPPCFRCGGRDCGKPDCNNILIPQQVACFASFLRLWRAIADSGRTTLVMEDDVGFRPHATEGFAFLAGEVAAGRLDLSPDKPVLLRLGWPLGEDHDAPQPFTLRPAVRMANHCFLITPAAARRAVALFDGVKTTSDIYLHAQVATRIESHSLFPPIAADLSWSEGKLASLIHPKPSHATHLARSGDPEAAERYRARITRHIKRKTARSLLVVGHPRTGTAYTAEALGQVGLDIGHEGDGRDGVASWMFVTDADPVPWHRDPVGRTRRALHWDKLILVLRDPLTAIPSIIRENRRAPASYAFRREAILQARGIDLDACGSEAAQAVWSLTSWTRMALDMKPDHVFRIGRDESALVAGLVADGVVAPDAVRLIDTRPVNSDKAYKGVRYPKPTLAPADWKALPTGAACELIWYCRRFDFALPPLALPALGPGPA